jgi:hypothetical protein
MDDLTAVPLEAQSLTEEISAGWLDDARTFFTGFVFTAVLTVLGAALVTVALVVGVVGAPIVAAAVAYVMFRSRRHARVRVLAT